MTKYFRNAFATGGDREAVPDQAVGTLVNYEKGYTPEYELDPDVDPAGNYVGRRRMNQLFNDITGNLKFWQENGVPAIVENDGTGSPLSYKKGFIGSYLGAVYRALIDDTTTLPPSAEWVVYDLQDELNTKANTSTQVIAGTGLNGGGNLSANRTLSVKYGTTAGTATQGNDSRITGAAQKSANLSDLSSAAAARQNLGLGTAATRNVGTASGNVMRVGAFGLGSQVLSTVSASDLNGKGLVSARVDPSDPVNTTGSAVAAIHAGLSENFGGGVMVAVQVNPSAHIYSVRSGVVSATVELLHTGNILTTTGQSADYPMTQKAVTDAINNSAIGVGQTWQDVTRSRSFRTTYTNTTGKPILVHVQVEGTSGLHYAYLTVGGLVVSKVDPGDKRYHGMLTAIVPNGTSYRMDSQGPTKQGWWELR